MSSRIRQHLPVFVAAIAAAALTAAAPAIAHGVKHALFAHNAGKLNGKPSRAFVQNKGLIRLSAGGSEWQARSASDADNIHREGSFTYIEISDDATHDFVYSPQVPTALYGRQLKLKAVEVCYNAEDAPAIETATVAVVSDTDIAAGNGVLSAQVSDSTARNDETCRRYALSTPERLSVSESVALTLSIHFPSTGNAQFYLGRTTVFLKPV